MTTTTNTARPNRTGDTPAAQPRDVEQLLALLDTGRGGLTQAEAASRSERFGPNELRERRPPVWRQLLTYFWGPIPVMIEIAAILSAAAGHWPDLGVILVLLLGNVAVGFLEERQAGDVIAALDAKLAPTARVHRDGTWRVLPARELVPGDVVRLRQGDIVPADLRLLDASLDVDQSALTGESLPVTRDAGAQVYSGSVVGHGEATGVVYATGERTFFGHTARLARDARTESKLQRAVVKIADYLIAVDAVLVAIILIVSFFRGDPLVETLQFTLVLTVAAIPVAMPTVLSITMAVGARRLAARRAIVAHLPAIEELAGVDVLCSDKTGTLTQNRLTLGEPIPLGAASAREVVLLAALAAKEEDQDPIDLAILGGVTDRDRLAAHAVLEFTPFDPVRKRTEALVRSPEGAVFRVSKGAPQAVLALITGADGVRAQVEAGVAGFAARGERALGVARTDETGRWIYAGLLPLFDPPREDSAATLREAAALGVAVKMVTGDQLAIARETAGRVGLGRNILDTRIFQATPAYQASQLAHDIETADGFAQVFPEHKYHIVEVLQQRGHMVAMTGDGVNDAPALRKAHVGIAVSGATDAARAAADLVLASPGLSVIVEAIRLSRRIFERMNSYAIYRIAETIRVLLFMALAILVFRFYPVTALMIVLLALLNDGAILTIARDHVPDRARPATWNLPVVLGVATSLGLLGVVETFGLFYLARRTFALDPATVRSVIFLKLAVAGHLTYFVARTRGPFWSLRPAKVVLLAVLGTQAVSTLVAATGVFMAPIGWGRAGLVWAYCLVWFLVEDAVKRGALQIFDRQAPGLLARGRRRRNLRPGAGITRRPS